MGKVQQIFEKHNGIIVLITGVIAIVFSFLSLITASQLNKNFDTLFRTPLSLSSDVFKVRQLITESQLYFHALALYNPAYPEPAFLLEELQHLEDEMQRVFTHMVTAHDEKPAEIEALKQSVYTIMEWRRVFLESPEFQAGQGDLKTLYDGMNPVFANITKDSNAIIAYAESGARSLALTSHRTLLVTVSFTLFLSLVLVLFALLSQGALVRKMRSKESYYREFLFNVLSENIDEVLMIYHLRTQSMELVSSNVQRILGINSKVLEDNAGALFEYCTTEECGELLGVFDRETLQTRMEKECMMLNPTTGEEKCMSIAIYPVHKGGKISRYIIAINDLTEAKQTQQVLRDALINSQNANRAKSDFLSNMSHEIRTPMNAIIGMTTIAATVMDKPDRLENCLSKIASSSRHLLMLINDILDMSKIESGKLALSHEPMLLTKLIDEICTIIYVQTQAKNQNFEVATDFVHENIIGDALRLKQVLINLLSNAVKYTPENGKIKFSIQEMPKRHSQSVWVRFSVSDNGIGMTPEFMEKLFQPFEQEGKISGGTGLGMAITKNLVTLANGRIHAYSQQGEGSTFVVELPFETPEGHTHHHLPPHFAELRVLIVDDDQDVCKHTSIILSRLGIRAQWVQSGHEAVETVREAIAKDDGFDIVLLDWLMPEMDGLATTRQLRDLEDVEPLFIILAAFEWGDIEDEARKAGVDLFITKPLFQSSLYNALLQMSRDDLDVSEENPVRTEKENDFSGRRFLLVEDNPINVEIATELLGMTNAQVESAINGQDAVDIFLKSPAGYYDLILMDVQMPIMDGYQATRAIRASKHPDAGHIPIIAMTANAFADDVVHALQAGMNAHIAKPIDFKNLCETIAQELP